jgi:hypothetical protein
MGFKDLLPGKFYNQDDVKDGPIVLTIAGFPKGTLTKDGVETSATFISFDGTERRLVMKSALAENLDEIFPEAKKPEDGIGHQVELYHDPNIKMGGKKVGGLRLRAPEQTKGPF